MRLHISAPLFCNASLANSHLCKIILLSDKQYQTPNTSILDYLDVSYRRNFVSDILYKYPRAKKLLQLKKNYETGDPNSQVFATLTKWLNKVFPILPCFRAKIKVALKNVITFFSREKSNFQQDRNPHAHFFV